jgi:hypothetical protein
MIVCTGGCPTFQEEVNAIVTPAIVPFSLKQLLSKKSLIFRERFKEYFTWALDPGLLFLGLEIILAHTRWRRIP